MLQSLLQQNAIFTTGAITKEELFEELSQRLSDTLSEESVAPEVIRGALEDREREMTTGIGLGVAIPHGRLAKLEKPMLVFCKTSEGIAEYETLDGCPVHLVFGLVTPADMPEAHSTILQEVSRIVQCPENRDLLLKCDSSRHIYELILKAMAS